MGHPEEVDVIVCGCVVVMTVQYSTSMLTLHRSVAVVRQDVSLRGVWRMPTRTSKSCLLRVSIV